MAKWTFAVLAVFGVVAEAADLAPTASGCVTYDEIIYEEITASGWGITGSDLGFSNMRDPTVVYCSTSSQTTSKFYSGTQPSVFRTAPRLADRQVESSLKYSRPIYRSR